MSGSRNKRHDKITNEHKRLDKMGKKKMGAKDVNRSKKKRMTRNKNIDKYTQSKIQRVTALR